MSSERAGLISTVGELIAELQKHNPAEEFYVYIYTTGDTGGISIADGTELLTKGVY
jgi:hypothetical protein